MLAFFAAIFGFVQSLAPDLLKFAQDKRDKVHELAILQLQLQQQKDGYNAKLDEISVNAKSVETAALQQSYRAEIKYSGKYAASVRPTITYMAMGLYVAQKLILIGAIIFAPDLPWLSGMAIASQMAIIIWTPFDEMILSWIVAFWFGSRQAAKLK